MNKPSRLTKALTVTTFTAFLASLSLFIDMNSNKIYKYSTPHNINEKALAFEQSFGFFDDITNEQWYRLQQITRRTFPNHFMGNIEEYITRSHSLAGARVSWWYNQNFMEEFRCMFGERIPQHASASANGDGAKWVCDPFRIAKQKTCLVYSIGSYGNTIFEEGVKEQIGDHCEIHTFDIVSENGGGEFEGKLKDLATFHHYGIGSQSAADKYEAFGEGPPLKSLKDIMQELGHVGKRIDIFKIDCEGCEWEVFPEMLSDDIDIRQVLIETHGAPQQEITDFFYSMHDKGYVITSKEPNLKYTRAIEYAFLKLSRDFFIEDSFYAEAEAIET